ncbi:MAG: signal recognition particle-docking protein FtsY, partial [Euryarchaeota archaeon]|nr:signal recognition particle-docking protein FtsY [Euryarchaeota archaeon]
MKKKLFGWKDKAAVASEAPQQIIGESGKKLSEGTIDDLLGELEMTLLEADVALPVVEEIKAGVRAGLVGKRVERGHEAGEAVELALKTAIESVLKGNEFDFDAFVSSRPRPVTIMFVGINGTGKTTAIAKIAYRLQKMGMSCVLSASDTFRAGAIEQIGIHGERLNCRVIKHKAGSDPAAVAFDAVEHAKARKRDVVLIDTAGRMQTNVNLMDEMKKIKRVVKPDLVVFVGDALAGNDAVEQAVAFDREVGIDAVILTKIDADARGGAALS